MLQFTGFYHEQMARRISKWIKRNVEKPHLEAFAERGLIESGFRSDVMITEIVDYDPYGEIFVTSGNLVGIEVEVGNNFEQMVNNIYKYLRYIDNTRPDEIRVALVQMFVYETLPGSKETLYEVKDLGISFSQARYKSSFRYFPLLKEDVDLRAWIIEATATIKDPSFQDCLRKALKFSFPKIKLKEK